MGRVLKLIAMLAAAIIALVLMALVAVGFLVDPNDYKQQIVAAVGESTGRELTLEGDLDLKLFPWVSVAVGQASLGNAPGFGDEPFAQISNARLSVKLLPLFSQRVEIGDIELDGLVLRLARDRRGRNNWSDLVADESTSEETVEAVTDDEGPAASLNVSGIEVTNAALYFNDAQQDNSVELENLNFRARGVAAEKHFPLNLQFDFKGPDIVASFDAAVDARLDIGGNVYDVRDADIKVTGRGDSIPGGEMDLTLAFAQLAADLNSGTLSIDKIAFVFDDLRASGDLTGENLLDGLVLKGPIKVESFSPQSVLQRFNVDLKTADDSVMQQSSAAAVLNFSPDGIMFSEVDLVLDDSRLTGNAGQLSQQIRFDLTADAIDVDRYLPPATEDDANNGDETEGSLDEVDLPLEAIRQANIRGKFTLQQAKFSGLSFSDLVLNVNAGNGELRLTPSAKAYGGSYAGNIAIKARAKDAVLSLEQNLKGIDLNPLGADLYQVDKVTGMANAAFKLSASGSNLGEIRRQLNGTMDLNLADGAWEGIDLWHEFRKARAMFKQEAAPEAPPGPPRTPFSSVTATANVNEGVIRNDDLRAVLPFMVLTGKGNVNLPNEQLDFDLVAEVLEKPELANDATVADLGGSRIPLKLSGPLSDPKLRPDFAALVKEEAKRKAKDKLLDAIGLGEKDEPAEGGEPAEEESPEDKLKEKLKGLFR